MPSFSALPARGAQLISQVEEYLLDLCFPRCCVGCGTPRSWLCPACRGAVQTRVQVTARADTDLAFLLSYLPFTDPLVRELLHTLKYSGVFELAPVLVGVIASSTDGVVLRQRLTLTAPAVLLPVPTSTHRERERGYNQAALLATALGCWLDVPVVDTVLQRVRQRGTQVGRSRLDRVAEVAGGFACCERYHSVVEGKQVILIDDLVTTGSTLRACAAALHLAQPQAVGALTIADADRHA